MRTDSEELLRRGIAAGAQTFDRYLAATGWEPDDIDRSFCHQVGVAHRKLMMDSLGLNPANDFATLETLGNTGSAGMPITSRDQQLGQSVLIFEQRRRVCVPRCLETP